MTKDPLSRYVTVQGILHSDPIALVSVYGPNINSPQFLEKLFFNLADTSSDVFIVGDFSLILDPILDWSSQKTSCLTQSALFLKRRVAGSWLG